MTTNFDKSSRKPIEVTWNDLGGQDVLAQEQRMRQAQAAPLVRQVGPPPVAPGAGSWWRGNLAMLVLAGLIGGLAAWGIGEVLLSPDGDTHWYGDSAKTGNVLFSLELTIVIGVIVAGWEGALARSWEKIGRLLLLAVPILVVAGLVGGFIADSIYESMTQNVLRDAFQNAQTEDEFSSYIRDHLHLPRGIAIAIVGLCCGAALGAASRSLRRAVNGTAGGAIGGFIGGFLFDYISSSSGVGPRLIAIVVTGTLIGLAIGLIEQARREHWLEIVSGGMAGKQFILYNAQTVIGSAPGCDITLVKDPGISPRQAALVQQSNGLALQGLDASRPVLVNGQPIANAVLAEGALVQLGSTLLRYRNKSESVAPVGPIVG